MNSNAITVKWILTPNTGSFSYWNVEARHSLKNRKTVGWRYHFIKVGVVWVSSKHSPAAHNVCTQQRSNPLKTGLNTVKSYLIAVCASFSQAKVTVVRHQVFKSLIRWSHCCITSHNMSEVACSAGPYSFIALFVSASTSGGFFTLPRWRGVNDGGQTPLSSFFLFSLGSVRKSGRMKGSQAAHQSFHGERERERERWRSEEVKV